MSYLDMAITFTGFACVFAFYWLSTQSILLAVIVGLLAFAAVLAKGLCWSFAGFAGAATNAAAQSAKAGRGRGRGIFISVCRRA
jgi:hypothetical protein